VNWEVTDSATQSTVFSATHARPATGVPEGGNFLFEDGRVEWRAWDRKDAQGTIDLGSKIGTWLFFYKLPGIATGSKQG